MKTIENVIGYLEYALEVAERTNTGNLAHEISIIKMQLATSIRRLRYANKLVKTRQR